MRSSPQYVGLSLVTSPNPRRPCFRQRSDAGMGMPNHGAVGGQGPCRPQADFIGRRL